MNERADLPDADQDRIDPPVPEVDVASVEGMPSSGSPEHALTEPREFPVPSPLVGEARCLNCDAPLLTRYCGNCAQRAQTVRMDRHWLWHEVQHGIFHVDRGIFFTIKELFVRPGHMISEYLEGKRKRYFPPLTLIMVLSSVLVLCTIPVADRYSELMATRILSDQSPEESGPLKTRIVQVFNKIQGHPQWITLMMLPLMTIGSWLFLRKYGHNFVEHVIINAYMAGPVTVISFLNIPLSFVPSHLHTLLMYGLIGMPMVTYRFWTFVQLYNEHHWRKVVVRSLAGMALSMLLYYVVIFAVIIGWVLSAGGTVDQEGYHIDI